MPGLNLNGILPTRSLADMAEAEKREAEARTNQPVVQSLATYVRQCWDVARSAKMQTVEPRLLSNLRQRRGEYDPDLLVEIQKQGMSDVFMMLTSNKCRAGSAWLRDTLLGARDEKCWTLDPTPIPDLPDEARAEAAAEATREMMAFLGAAEPTPELMVQIAQRIRDRTLVELRDIAQKATARMERKMEDQMAEGGFATAFSAFLDDLMTFPSAILKGPITRNKPRLAWKKDPTTGDAQPEVADQLVAEWERVDPFMLYPAPSATAIDDGFLIERHKLSRTALTELRGVDGYDNGAINAVLEEYGRGGLQDWLYVDTAKAQAEGRSLSAVESSPEAAIDALQFWGSVQGRMLVEWGMSEADIGDLAKEFHCEIWLIGRWVIKATLNYDPFHRKPYFKASFEEVPGCFWGNAPPDLIRDCQVMCNAAARAMANNMGIASGPQVVYNIDRLPAGEDLTQMYPWKIWQVANDPYGNAAPPMQFFQPNSLAQELMAIYEKFSVLADEFSGIPRYMTGDNASLSGAGRTASGMSMLMSNAGKTIKQVINNIDLHVIKPAVERLYLYNMRYATDPDLKYCDVNIVARGANSLVVKDAAQVRRNEFLQLVLSSPMAQQIVGEQGVRALMHEQAKTLDMDADAIVPSVEVVALQQQAMAAQQALLPQPTPSGEQLMTGEPTTDHFSPTT